MSSVKSITSLLFTFSIFFGAKAQDSSIFKGYIQSKNEQPAGGVNIINYSTGTGTSSDENGYFVIPARLGDSIYFSSVQFENKLLAVTAEMISGECVIVLEERLNELDEVQISDLRLSGYLENDLEAMPIFKREAYGIPFPKKYRTPTERRLFAATTGAGGIKLSLANALMGTVPLDPILNAINGRTKYLKKLDRQDKLEISVWKGISLFPEHFFTDHLHIPESEIENFVFYCAYQSTYQQLLAGDDLLALARFFEEQQQEFLKLREIDE